MPLVWLEFPDGFQVGAVVEFSAVSVALVFFLNC